MANPQNSAHQIADRIIALRDPFLPLTPISKLVEKQALWSVETSEPSEEFLATVWDILAELATWMEDRRCLVWFEVPSDFPMLIGGIARPLPNEKAQQIHYRNQWRQVLKFDNSLTDMSPKEFEDLGRMILKWYGIANPRVTKHAGDAGLDFIGEGRMGEIIGREVNKWTVVDACKVVFVGQAKKYDKLVVGTSDLRELIGSVVLMQRDSYRNRFGYGEFTWSLMQPRVLMFITTSRFSKDAVKLAEEAGVILADRDQICKIYLAKLDTVTPSFAS